MHKEKKKRKDMDTTKTKEIECECGYYLLDNDGKKWYHAGATFNGYCFKDRNAFESGEGIAYLPECYWEDLKEESAGEAYEEPTTYTCQDFINIVTEHFDEIGADKKYYDADFVLWNARILFENVDWQHPETAIQEAYYYGDNDIEGDYQYFLKHKSEWQNMQ